VLLELGSSRQVEPEHDEGHQEQHASEDAEHGDGDGHSDDCGQHDETINTQVVEGVHQASIHDILVLGEGHQDLTNRVAQEEAKRSKEDPAGDQMDACLGMAIQYRNKKHRRTHGCWLKRASVCNT
jgi:hypothetical protein